MSNRKKKIETWGLKGTVPESAGGLKREKIDPKKSCHFVSYVAVKRSESVWENLFRRKGAFASADP